VFAAAYALAATLLLPAAPFTISAGLLFGPVLGTGIALVGATIGATGAFLLGGVLGRGAVEQFDGQRVGALDRYLSRRGFAAVLLVRLVPLFPFNRISGFGVCRASARRGHRSVRRTRRVPRTRPGTPHRRDRPMRC
jgi:uncharacterized membrane protein YdjX (TVP38/TMEM64 family)